MRDKTTRFSVSVPEDLLNDFDLRLQKLGKPNRSDTLRILMRSFVAEAEWQENTGQVHGSVTLMYGHHTAGISKSLTSLQHRYGDVIVCTSHAHLSENDCLECVIVKGDSRRIHGFIENLNKLKGLKSLQTVISV